MMTLSEAANDALPPTMAFKDEGLGRYYQPKAGFAEK